MGCGGWPRHTRSRLMSHIANEKRPARAAGRVVGQSLFRCADHSTAGGSWLMGRPLPVGPSPAGGANPPVPHTVKQKAAPQQELMTQTVPEAQLPVAHATSPAQNGFWAQ